MNLKEIKKLSADELKDAEKNLRSEVMNLRFDQAVGKLLDSTASRKKRVELARVLTMLNQSDGK